MRHPTTGGQLKAVPLGYPPRRVLTKREARPGLFC